MSPRVSAAVRLVAVLLLTLAVSPLTAPFASAQPSQLFGTPDPDDGPLVGARKGADEPVAGLGGWAPLVLAGPIEDARVTSQGHGLPRGVDALHLPLRI